MKAIEETNFIRIFFQNFLNNKSIKHYSRNTSLGAAFAERFEKSLSNLLKKPVFEKNDGNWADVLPTITEQHNNWIHSSTKLTPIQFSLKRTKDLLTIDYWTNKKKIKTKI